MGKNSDGGRWGTTGEENTAVGWPYLYEGIHHTYYEYV